MYLTHTKYITNHLLTIFSTRVQSPNLLNICNFKSATSIKLSSTHNPFFYRILCILSCRSCPQMVWVYAQWCIARMANNQTIRNFPFMHFIGITVRSLKARWLNREITISSTRLTARPNPATTSLLINEAEKPQFWRYSFPFIPRWNTFLKCHLYIVPCTLNPAI